MMLWRILISVERQVLQFSKNLICYQDDLPSKAAQYRIKRDFCDHNTEAIQRQQKKSQDDKDTDKEGILYATGSF